MPERVGYPGLPARPPLHRAARRARVLQPVRDATPTVVTVADYLAASTRRRRGPWPPCVISEPSRARCARCGAALARAGRRDRDIPLRGSTTPVPQRDARACSPEESPAVAREPGIAAATCSSRTSPRARWRPRSGKYVARRTSSPGGSLSWRRGRRSAVLAWCERPSLQATLFAAASAPPDWAVYRLQNSARSHRQALSTAACRALRTRPEAHAALADRPRTPAAWRCRIEATT
jgi:hypothetical protein